MYHQNTTDFMCSGAGCLFDDPTKKHLLHHIREKIPTKIHESQSHLLPRRADFLDTYLRPLFAKHINLGKPILFMPNSVIEKNDWVGGSKTHKTYIFGILPCGSKTCIILDGVDVHFDVQAPKSMTSVEFESYLICQMKTKRFSYIKTSQIKLYDLHGFQTSKAPFVRIHFRNLQDRRKVIDFIKEQNRQRKVANQPVLNTAADDIGKGAFYYPKIAREQRFNTADWNRIEKYVVENSSITTNCDYVLRVHVDEYEKLRKDKRKVIMDSNPFLSKTIDRDPTMVAMWDIETYRTVENGQVPTVDDDFVIFMMNSSYFPQHSDVPYVNICAVHGDTNARQGIDIVIQCDTEVGVLKAHMEAMSRMAPDVTAAYNGGNFDWPLYREKLRRNGLLVLLKSKFSSLPTNLGDGPYAETEDSVLRWCFTKAFIKIDAETQHVMECVATFPGMLDTDVMPVFLKMYPRAEVRKAASLNFFLSANGIESKADMPYKRMFRIYDRANKLITAPKHCHCNDDSVRNTCKLCNTHVREIDYIPLSNTDVMGEEAGYSTKLHPDLMNSIDGEVAHTKCCHCGKRPRNAVDMSDVAYYCTVDCLRPQQLYVKRAVVADKRELANLAYVSLYDAFYRADGMKVCNLTGTYCHKRATAFSNIDLIKGDHEKDHYPGAWVFPPNRGLHSDGWTNVSVIVNGAHVTKKIRCRPITGLDFSSLYPSIMMADNESPDKIVYDREEASRLEAEGYSLHHIKPFKYERGEKKGLPANKHLVKEGWTVRHNGVFNEEQTHIVEKYIKVEKCTLIDKTAPAEVEREMTWPVDVGPNAEQAASLQKYDYNRKIDRQAVLGREAKPGEMMGIFPTILKKLFDKRVPIKRELGKWVQIIAEMDLAGVTEWKITNPDGSESVVSYGDAVFNRNKANAKQNAIKLLSNTFYGKSGDFRAPIYELLVAAGVTTAGQEYIKAVAQFVMNTGFHVHYGDTDSLYLSCPDSVYAECDAEYENAFKDLCAEFDGVPNEPLPKPNTPAAEFKRRRIEIRVIWWTKQVEITMEVIKKLQGTVSNFLCELNGTTFLNMAYEEVGLPTVLCGKKKYFMTPHIEKVNFYPKEYFIKGIEIIKQGCADITKQLGDEFIREALSPENERDLLEIAEDMIRKFYKMDITLSMVAQSNKYRPDKKNVPVQRFIQRMYDVYNNTEDPVRQALYEPPEAGDKFQYVIIKVAEGHTVKGTKVKLGKGDKMELLRVYRASQDSSDPMIIDKNYYMKGVLGTMKRFIAYHERFQPPADMFDLESGDKEIYTAHDKYCITQAEKYLWQLCHSITGYDKTALQQAGVRYREVYRKCVKAITDSLRARVGPIAELLTRISVTDPINDIITAIRADVRNEDMQHDDYARRIIALSQKNNVDIKQLRSAYHRNLADRVTYYEQRENAVIASLAEYEPTLIHFVTLRERNLQTIINSVRDLVDLVGHNDKTAVGRIMEDFDSPDWDDQCLANIMVLRDHVISLTAICRGRARLLATTTRIESEIAHINNERMMTQLN